jgi:hypothetical protein
MAQSRARLTAEQQRRIVQRYRAGELIASIARDIGCSISYPGRLAARRWVGREAFPSRKPAASKPIRGRIRLFDALEEQQQATSLRDQCR